MASRMWTYLRGALEREVCILFGEIAIAGTGAPSIANVKRNKGIAGISRTSTGLYVLTLQDKYQRLLSFKAIQIKAAAEELDFQVSATNVNPASGVPTITFLCSAGGVAADPASGDVLLLEISLSNSIQP